MIDDEGLMLSNTQEIRFNLRGTEFEEGFETVIQKNLKIHLEL